MSDTPLLPPPTVPPGHAVDYIIAGGTLLTLDAAGTLLRGGSVAIRGSDIVDLGPAARIAQQYQAAHVIDASRALVLPGLVNGHTHAAMTCFRGLADDLELMSWLNDHIFPAESRNVDPELAYWGSLLACAEMIRSGTTTFCDMYMFEEETARAARSAGMRCVLGEVLFDFPSPSAATPAEGLARAERLARDWAGDPLVNVLIEPHALYTCSPALLKEAKTLADAYSLPVATHFLETRSELQTLQERLGCRPSEFLRDLGYLDERFIAFHGVCMDERDIELFAAHGCSVVHNPESNMKLASGVAPIARMIEAGIPVGLGTDGCASNNNLDLFQEMDSAAKLEKSARLDPTILPAPTVLRMATSEGARVLGLGDAIGALRPGLRADLILIGLDEPHLTPMYSEISHLVYAVNGADVDTVFIHGRPVMRDRKLLTIDLDEVMTRVRRIAERIAGHSG